MTVLGFIVRLSKMALSPLYCLAVGKTSTMGIRLHANPKAPRAFIGRLNFICNILDGMRIKQLFQLLASLIWHWPKC